MITTQRRRIVWLIILTMLFQIIFSGCSEPTETNLKRNCLLDYIGTTVGDIISEFGSNYSYESWSETDYFMHYDSNCPYYFIYDYSFANNGEIQPKSVQKIIGGATNMEGTSVMEGISIGDSLSQVKKIFEDQRALTTIQRNNGNLFLVSEIGDYYFAFFFDPETELLLQADIVLKSIERLVSDYKIENDQVAEKYEQLTPIYDRQGNIVYKGVYNLGGLYYRCYGALFYYMLKGDSGQLFGIPEGRTYMCLQIHLINPTNEDRYIDIDEFEVYFNGDQVFNINQASDLARRELYSQTVPTFIFAKETSLKYLIFDVEDIDNVQIDVYFSHTYNGRTYKCHDQFLRQDTKTITISE